jgi:hypothetical protein
VAEKGLAIVGLTQPAAEKASAQARSNDNLLPGKEGKKRSERSREQRKD